MFLGEPLGFFTTVSSDVFIFLHAFISSDGFIFLCAFNYSCFCFFRCFYCWLHLFNSLFLHCLSGTLFLCCYHECYRFERQFFTPRHFLPYAPSCFYQGFPRTSGSALKVVGLPTEVRNTDSAHVVVWITLFRELYLN